MAAVEPELVGLLMLPVAGVGGRFLLGRPWRVIARTDGPPRQWRGASRAGGRAGTIVAFDLVWYSTLAFLVIRARRAFVEGPWLRRAERLTGCVLIGLGAKLALERR